MEGARLLGPPESVQRPDYLIMESTYGDRQREETEDRTEQLFRILERTLDRGGRVVIPSFAVGRAQEVMARINDLVEAGRLTGVPVFVDSPMATAATKVFALHPEVYSDEARRLLRAGDAPLEFPGLRMVTEVQESMEINDHKGPAIIISPSGMCTAGRVKHHLKHNISNPKCTILFVGYQAANTLGRIIKEGTNPVRIFQEWYDVKADIETIEGFSAHADLDELLAWYDSLGRSPAADLPGPWGGRGVGVAGPAVTWAGFGARGGAGARSDVSAGVGPEKKRRRSGSSPLYLPGTLPPQSLHEAQMTLRLTTLGNPSAFLGPEEFTSLPGKPVTFGLLVFLAVEREATRDRLVSVFWPESTQENARHALSQTLYELRQTLGEDWVESAGNSVRVDGLPLGRLPGVLGAG